MPKRTFWMLLVAFAAFSQPQDRWKPLRFLIGSWKADNGSTSFALDLEGRVLVRRNVNNTPGQKHEDLMVVYEEGGSFRAIYFDTEGHTIRYAVSTPEANTAVFDSAGNPGPSYRLSYRLESGKLAGKFEVGGKPYLAWTSTRE